MKQIVDKLNKIAKKIDESVEIPQTDLIIDSLDAITKAYGGTPNDSNLIVDKLEDIYNNIGSGGGGGGLPTTELTIINNIGKDIYPNEYTQLFNLTDNAIEDASDIAAGETVVLNAVYVRVEILGDVVYYVQPAYQVDQGTLTYRYTNLVNCASHGGGGGAQLDITDPTQNSSATLTITLDS